MEGKQHKTIGKYLVTPQLLGQGSFSSVFLAYDQHNKALAAKIIALDTLESTCRPI
jgi:serine/threonine protein kinase